MSAAAPAAPRNPLWRYNLRILVGAGAWVLVLPIAASQVVTLWMFALAGDFTDMMASKISEMMTSILGAFLVAHSMAPEYRSGIGAVLACKPVSLHKVVTVRVALAMLAAITLSVVTLTVCHLGLKPVDLGSALLAGLPSLWFLSMLALNFATLFRNALAGFAVAGGLWALDVAVGYSIHPLLSLQGRTALLETEALAEMWVPSKVVLLVCGTLLLLTHGRLLPRICRAAERRDVTRIAVTVAGILMAYAASGAATTVSHAYLHRGSLSYPDVVWLRARMKVYGPVPVAKLFGPAFSAYLFEAPIAGNPEKKDGPNLRFLQLEQARERWPQSIWADGICFTLGRERELTDPAGAAKAYVLAADKHPHSPFAPKALGAVLRLKDGSVKPQEHLLAARKLLSDYPRTREAERGADLLMDLPDSQVKPDERLKAALIAAEIAPRVRRPVWLVQAAEMQERAGDRNSARQNAQKALDAGRALVAIDRENAGRTEIAQQKSKVDEVIREAEKLLARLK